MMKNISLSAASLLLAGCAGTTPMVLGPDHPASPDAAAAALVPLSTTLVVDEPVQSPRPVAMQGTHHDMGGMQHGSGQVNHAAPGARSAPPPMQHGNNEGHGAAATAPASAGQTPAAQPAARQAMYACPMHEEVTSSNPNDRCPKCKMKINKPVKKAAAPAAAGGNAGHGSEHGGH